MSVRFSRRSRRTRRTPPSLCPDRPRALWRWPAHCSARSARPATASGFTAHFVRTCAAVPAGRDAVLRAAPHDRRRRACRGRRQPGGRGQRLRAVRPRRAPTALPTDARRRARPSRSSTPTTTRTPEPTSRTYRSQFGLPPCTTANGCFKQGQPERRRRRRSRPRTPAGPARSRSTSTWSRRSARTARSCSSRRRSPTIANLGTAVNTAVAHGRGRRLEQLRRLGDLERDELRHLVLQPPRRRDHRVVAATAATASSTRPPRRTSPRSAARRSRRATQRARLDGDRLDDGAGQRLLGLRGEAVVADTTPAARGARSPTSPRSPTRPPASRSTTRTARAAGRSSAARASSSPIIASRLRAGRHAGRGRLPELVPVREHRARCST